eukprot:1626631-Alexandrium_andersonii.AAC.1
MGIDVAQLSGVIDSADQRAVSDRLRMTRQELAGDALGFELWRLRAREHEAPEQPVAQREFKSAGCALSAAGVPQSPGPDSQSG